eukprot:scaffold366421_cov18-Prasinocladus_malaysianus.AAC.1
MPLAAPVTTATFPANLASIFGGNEYSNEQQMTILTKSRPSKLSQEALIHKKTVHKCRSRHACLLLLR